MNDSTLPVTRSPENGTSMSERSRVEPYRFTCPCVDQRDHEALPTASA